jgi:serine/threonine-protein kinase ATR
LREIIVRIVAMHPYQCFWHILPAVMSDDPTVSVEAEKILREVTKMNPLPILASNKMKEIGKIFMAFANEGEKLKNKVFRLKDLGTGYSFKSMIRGSKLLLPYRKFMRVEMPPGGRIDPDHKYFAEPIFMTDMDELVQVFQSIAKPKRITVMCDDGHKYPLLVKPKDDMRMDSRVIELIEVINRLLHKDAESRRRQLHIRSFHVVPLGSAGGIVEFISGVQDIRSILLGEYVRKMNTNQTTLWSELLEKYPKYCKKQAADKQTASGLCRHFENHVMSKLNPPVFADWFMSQYPNASDWLAARTRFTRSLAVMSIVGYVIGLGDRHLENILMDKTTGQVIHVDFNVLFNKGVELEVPEVVPFRLTHNLINAMGLTKYEGVFRKTCEITLQVMTDNRQELISVLKPIVYKPFAEKEPGKAVTPERSVHSKVKDILCSRSSQLSAPAHEIEKLEIRDELAAKNLKNIDQRLRGRIVFNNEPNQLSVAGHVDHVIRVLFCEFDFHDLTLITFCLIVCRRRLTKTTCAGCFSDGHPFCESQKPHITFPHLQKIPIYLLLSHKLTEYSLIKVQETEL